MASWTTPLVLVFALSGAAYGATDAPPKDPSAKGAPSTKTETAKADENRKKPLQRCDELKDQAQLDCLKKARERIVEARAKRESKAANK